MEDLIKQAHALEPHEQHRLAERIAANVGYDLIAEGAERVFRNAYFGLSWALELIDLYDERLIALGDPPEKVNTPRHLDAKRTAFRDLNELGAMISKPSEAVVLVGRSLSDISDGNTV